jgi:glycosyltransferase involved in cell wall biosynthesis
MTPVTVIMPVLNEEANIAAALASVEWATERIVVDSGSTDGTRAAAEAVGATVIDFDYEPGGPKKKAWILSHIRPQNEWVLLLDADERVTDELRDEIRAAIASPEADGFYIDREFVFMGRPLRCFQPNWNMRLFRRGRGAMEDLGLADLPGTGDNEIHEHVEVDGRTAFLSSPLLHDDYRGLTPWLDRHNNYATWEAHLYRKLRVEPIGISLRELVRLDPFRRKRALRRIWVRLPGRPLIRFFVWYVLRRGFLDGRPGFIFCVLMAYYEFVIGAKLRELRTAPR